MQTKIEVTLPEGADAKMEEWVIAACADAMLNRYVFVGEDDVDRVPTALRRALEDQVKDVIAAQARAATPGIVNTILEQGVRAVGSFGDPHGPTMPVREFIAQEIKREMTRGSGSRDGNTVLVKVIREEVQKVLADELKAVVEEAKGPVLDAVRTEASRVLERAMRSAIS